MPTVDDSLDDKFAPVTREDVADTDPTMLANHMRALQREVRSGFELITQRLLTAIERLNDRFDDVKAEVAELKRLQARTEERLAALETTKSKRAAKGPRKKR